MKTNSILEKVSTKLLNFFSLFISERKLIKIIYVLLEKLVKSTKNNLDDKILKIIEESDIIKK